MNGLTSITIQGREIGLKFGMQAARLFLQHMSNDFDRLEHHFYNEKDIANLLYAGYVNYCSINDEVPSMTLGRFIDMVEDNLEECSSDFERVARVWEESKHTRRLMEGISKAAEEATSKKKKMKRTGNSSSLSVTENLASKATKNSAS